MSSKIIYETLNRIKSEINKNEFIHDISHMSIQIKTLASLFRKTNIIQIIGRVNQTREKDEIERIAAANAGKMQIVSTLRVEYR